MERDLLLRIVYIKRQKWPEVHLGHLYLRPSHLTMWVLTLDKVSAFLKSFGRLFHITTDKYLIEFKPKRVVLTLGMTKS